MINIYQIKDGADVEVLKELGFEYLPKELYGTEEAPNILYKIVVQPQDGQCVGTLIDFYQAISDKICTDRQSRRAHAKMGIKYKYKDGVFKLIVTPAMREMFSLWRIEMNFETGDVYFTISDGNMPSFYNSDVLEKYCGEDVDTLVLNNIIEKVENVVA